MTMHPPRRKSDRFDGPEFQDGRPQKLARLDDHAELSTLLSSSREHLMEPSDSLLMDMLESNTALLSQRDSLHDALKAVLDAFGLPHEQARDIAVRISHQRSNSSKRYASPVDSACDPAPNMTASPLRSSVDVECDRRMREAKQPSCFTLIGRHLRGSRHVMHLGDSDMVAAIAAWRQGSMDVDAIFQLARDNWGIDREPSQVLDIEMLERTIQTPDFLIRVVQELHLCPSKGTQLALVTRRQSQCPPLLDEIGRKRRAMIACALESTRGWRYHSPVERIATFWALYRLLTLLVFPTSQNMAKCPPWYRPLPSQYRFAHPFWIDYVHWPMIRERFVHVWDLYQETEFYSTFLCNLRLDFEAGDQPLINLNAQGTDLVLNPAFHASVDDLRKFSMSPTFTQLYPELLGCVQRHSPEDNEPGGGFESSSVSSLQAPQALNAPSTAIVAGVDVGANGNEPSSSILLFSSSRSSPSSPALDFVIPDLDVDFDFGPRSEPYAQGDIDLSIFGFMPADEPTGVFEHEHMVDHQFQ